MSLLVCLAVLTISSTALAGTYVLPPGTTWIGTVYQIPGSVKQPGRAGWTMMVTQDDAGGCASSKLGPARNGVLGSGETVYFDGQYTAGPTPGQINISFVTARTTFCGWQLDPPPLAGHQVIIDGGDFGDTIVNTSVTDFRLHGNGGGDLLWNRYSPIPELTYGEGGGDVFIVEHNQAAAGEEDSDLFCVLPGETAARIDGESGAVSPVPPHWNVLCGKARVAYGIDERSDACSCWN